MAIGQKVPDWLIGLILTLLFLFITSTGTFDFTDKVEMRPFFSRPEWIPFTELAILAFFGLFITFVLPGLKAGTGAVAILGLLVGHCIIGTILFFSSDIWLRISPPVLLLILGYILVTLKRVLNTGMTKEKEEKQIRDLLYNRGLDYERKRLLKKALPIYKLIIEKDGKSLRALAKRIPDLKRADASTILGSAGSKYSVDLEAVLAADTDTKSTIGPYVVTSPIEQGTIGMVYKGKDPKTDRTVAIKTLVLSEFDEGLRDKIKDHFFKEAESARLLTHPNIATIYDYGEEHNMVYIAVEYIEGKALDWYAGGGRLLPTKDTLVIIARVADALDYAHSRNVVHQCIRPANIMKIKETNDVKVTDFGIGRIASVTKTKASIISGMASYMSPEQISGKTVDARSDIFSLGVVLFEMLTGQKPFIAEDTTSLMFKIAKEEHPSPKAINSRIPRFVEMIIDRALEKNPQKRYQRAGQMAAHLKQVVAKIDIIVAQR